MLQKTITTTAYWKAVDAAKIKTLTISEQQLKEKVEELETRIAEYFQIQIDSLGETKTGYERRKTEMEKTIKEMKEKLEEVEPCTTLPVIVNKEEVKLHKTNGTDFDGDIDFIK